VRNAHHQGEWCALRTLRQQRTGKYNRFHVEAGKGNRKA
jgi:hypothetical protein